MNYLLLLKGLEQILLELIYPTSLNSSKLTQNQLTDNQNSSPDSFGM